jgi:hypothetical protein
MGWCDITLEGFEWRESGRDLMLRMSEPLPGSNAGRRRTVTCQWAEALDVSLRWAEGAGGPPHTWDGSITPLPDGRFSVELDFASHGHLRLVCSEIEVRTED